ncbi:hypothetical protein [Nocardia shimofusensis]|uniref:hypothetical protein n=1 Tax=Nocardia shimofusensis TaxID=228596 RepID=UPI00082EF6AF|nr:hypothetical protein [Nocardia shimofusensis]
MTTATTRQRASIIHGYSATPDDHWFGWLAGRLDAKGIPATVPALPELDPYIGDGCDITGLRDRVDRLRLLRSDADVFVPVAHTDRLAGLLGTTASVVPGAGHFLASDGVTALPEVLHAIG